MNRFLGQHTNPNSVGFLFIDDTVNHEPDAKKIEGLNYLFSYAEVKNVWSHCVMTSSFFVEDISTPVTYQAYYRKEQCESISKSFKSRMEIVQEFVRSFKSPSHCSKLDTLLDSCYSNQGIIMKALKKDIILLVL